jgi:hypothetical protein
MIDAMTAMSPAMSISMIGMGIMIPVPGIIQIVGVERSFL